MFKRSPSLTEQVKSHLKQRIINAEFNGGRIPPEMDLARDLKVSRNTVRDALGRLEAEGIVSRRQGSGTYVNQAGLLVKNRLEEIIPYQTMIEESGFTPTVELVKVEEKQVDPQVAARLDISPTEKMLVFHKRFLASGEPVIYSVTHIPLHFIQSPYTHNDLLPPVYKFVPQFCGQAFAYYLSEIIPLVAPDWLAEQLNLPEGERTLLTFQEIGYNQDNQPIFQACSHFRHDLLRLRLIRRLAQ